MSKGRNKIKDYLFNPLSALIILFILLILFLVVYPKVLEKRQLEKYKYNDFPFYKDKFGLWHTVVNWQGNDVALTFFYHPKELENISIDPRAKKLFFNPYLLNIFYVFDPDEKSLLLSAMFELLKITSDQGGLLNKRSVFATSNTTNSSIEAGVPTITCEANASLTNLVIHFKVNETYNNTITVSQPNCIFIYAKDYYDARKLADRLAYSVLSIMD